MLFDTENYQATQWDIVVDHESTAAVKIGLRLGIDGRGPRAFEEQRDFWELVCVAYNNFIDTLRHEIETSVKSKHGIVEENISGELFDKWEK